MLQLITQQNHFTKATFLQGPSLVLAKDGLCRLWGGKNSLYLKYAIFPRAGFEGHTSLWQDRSQADCRTDEGRSRAGGLSQWTLWPCLRPYGSRWLLYPVLSIHLTVFCPKYYLKIIEFFVFRILRKYLPNNMCSILINAMVIFRILRVVKTISHGCGEEMQCLIWWL